jgi:hypothetical protein
MEKKKRKENDITQFSMWSLGNPWEVTMSC